MDKITAIKIKYTDNTYSEKIPLTVLAKNVDWNENKNLVDILGTVDLNKNIQDQINQLYNNKISLLELNSYINDELNNNVTLWLDQHVSPINNTVLIDKSFSIEGAAADSKEINNVIYKTTGAQLIGLIPGHYIDTHGSPGDVINLVPGRSSNYNNGGYAVVDCQEGDKFIINGKGATYGRLWCFIDSNNTIIENASNTTPETDLIITAPQNSTKLIINSTISGLSMKNLPVEQKINIEQNTREKLANSIAEEYDQTKTYLKGEYVKYNGKFFKCIMPIEEAENWTGAHWTQVNLANDIIKEQNEKIENILEIQNHTFQEFAENQFLYFIPECTTNGVLNTGEIVHYITTKRWITDYISVENLHQFNITKRVTSSYIIGYDSQKTFKERITITNAMAPLNIKSNIIQTFKNNWAYVRYMVVYDDETPKKVFLNDIDITYNTKLANLIHEKAKFNTVADMIIEDLNENAVVQTYGYYTIGDGGGAIYKICTDNTNNLLSIKLNNGLYAKMIYNDKIDLRQLGFIKNNNQQDISPALKLIDDLSSENESPLTLFFPYGFWYTRPYNFHCRTGVHLIGENANCYVGQGFNSVLCPYTSNQLCIIRIGNDIPYTPQDSNDIRTREITSGNDICRGYYIDDLAFFGDIAVAAIVMVGVAYSKIGDVEFRKIDGGNCISLSGCFEMNFGKIYFRSIYSYKPCILFNTIPKTDTSLWSINSSSNYFEYLSFEGMNGSGIETTEYAFATGNQFNAVDFEQRITPNKSGDTVSKAYGSREEAIADGATNFTNHYIFNGYFDNTTVNAIEAYITTNIYKKDGTSSSPKWHMLKALFSDSVTVTQTPGDLNALRNMMSVGSVSVKSVNEINDDFSIVYSKNTNRGAVSSLVIGTLNTYEHNPHIYDSYNGMILKIGIINGRRYNQLNTLMDKQYVNPRTSGFGAATLLTLDDAVDVSGCVLKVNNNVFPAMCVKGITDLTMWVKVVKSTTTAIDGERECNIIIKTYDGFDGNETHSNNPYTFHYSGGLQKIQITNMDFFNDQYIKIEHDCTESMVFVIIYKIETT